MRWLYPAGLVLALLIGLGIGRLLAPRYVPPADSSEARLKARAVEFYQAGRLFDALKMRQLYTPARQYAESGSLQEEAASQGKIWDTLDASEKQERQASAERITPECLEVELYTGDDWGWAVTKGVAPLLVDGKEIPQQLDQLVWVRSDGEWWVYDRTINELNAYGNPPDYILKIFELWPHLTKQSIALPPSPSAQRAQQGQHEEESSQDGAVASEGKPGA